MIDFIRSNKRASRNCIFGKLTTPLFTKYQPLITKSGFTFIELIIVVATIGVLSTLFIATYPAAQRRARDAERRSDIKQYQTAMESYANNHNGNYQDTSAMLLAKYCDLYLNTAVCPDDSQSSYMIYSTSTLYILWATLEQDDDSGNTQYFVVCSDGRTGETTNTPNYTACPL